MYIFSSNVIFVIYVSSQKCYLPQFIIKSAIMLLKVTY